LTGRAARDAVAGWAPGAAGGVGRIGILGILAALVTGSADAMDVNRSCLHLLEENDGAKVSPARQTGSR
jgi:hypothetical protein